MAASQNQLRAYVPEMPRDLGICPLWKQLGSDIEGEDRDDRSGISVSMSNDGNIIAIGAIWNTGNDGGLPSFKSGHVRVYTVDDTNAWSQLGSDIDGESAQDSTGFSVSLSGDGKILATGARYNDGDNGSDSGHVRVYALDDTNNWVKRGEDIDGEAPYDYMGSSVAMSNDGGTVAIGAESNDGNGHDSGHVQVYHWNTTHWSKRGEDINGEAIDDESGGAVSISNNGMVVAIGAAHNDGNGDDGNDDDVGHVRIYEWNTIDLNWVQRGDDIDGESNGDRSGTSVSLSGGGTVVAIGALRNDGNAKNAGSVRIYEWVNSDWVKRGDDIDGEAANDNFGVSVSLSNQGSAVAIGARYNDVNGLNSGNVRVYEWVSSTTSWEKRGDSIDGEATLDYFGSVVSMSHNGKRVAIGAKGNKNDKGHVRVMEWVSPTCVTSEPSSSPSSSSSPSALPTLTTLPTLPPTPSVGALKSVSDPATSGCSMNYQIGRSGMVIVLSSMVNYLL